MSNKNDTNLEAMVTKEDERLSKEDTQTKFFDRPFFTHTAKFFVPTFVLPLAWGVANGIDRHPGPVMWGLCGAALLPWALLPAGWAEDEFPLMKRGYQVGFGALYGAISYGVGYGLGSAVNYASNLF